MSPLSIGKPLLTDSEVAEVLRCSVSGVKRLCASRALASQKAFGKKGRRLVRATDLIAYLDKTRIAAIGEH